MLRLWQQSWFLIAVVLILSSGLAAGLFGPASLSDGFLAAVRPNVTTTIVLFLMAFSLDSTRLREALRHPAGALWGSLVNLALLPAVAAACAWGISPPDFAIGLIITAVSPCTLATASVFTRRAGGNDAISLVVTLLTNVACVAITPLWLQALVARGAEFDMNGIVTQLVFCVLLPTVIGQLCLWPEFGRRLAERYRSAIGVLAQGMVLLIVLVAAVGAGRDLRSYSTWPSVGETSIMAAMCLAVHVVGLLAGWCGGGALRLTAEDRIATAIAGAQKTLPVGLLMATNPSVVAFGMPFVAFPLLVYHATQLLLDTAIADAWRMRRAEVRFPLPPSSVGEG